MEHRYFVYILTNQHHTVLYTGVTNDLVRRVSEHREKIIPGFTKRYNVYPAHTIIRNFFGLMTRKLSVTSSQ